ncbi:MAG: response regulator [Candidatus Aceula lacicola]|nr:response regulator [Candidatus Aceula lacicola]
MEKKKIVIIDDEKDFCFLMKSLLEGMGPFEVDTALDGEEGYYIVLEKKPDLIFLDYVMPKMRGDEVLRLLRQNSETDKIPVVITSGLGEATYLEKEELDKQGISKDRIDRKKMPTPKRMVGEIFKKAQNFESIMYLEKPFSRETLLGLVRKILGDF